MIIRNGGPSLLQLDDVHRHVAMFMLERFLGAHEQLDVDSAVDLASRLQKLYFACERMARMFTANEVCPTDAYLLLAAHILWKLWTDTQEDKYFWQAIVPMEFALNIIPANFHIRFALIKFYSHAGQ